MVYGLIASSGFLVGVSLGLFTLPPGCLLAGAPENAAIGIGRAAEEGAGLGLVPPGAVFPSNPPGSMTSAVVLRAEGRSTAYIVAAWAIVAVACTAACVLGHAVPGALPPELIGAVPALAAGGIPATPADTMMPEASWNGRPLGRDGDGGRLRRRLHARPPHLDLGRRAEELHSHAGVLRAAPTCAQGA